MYQLSVYLHILAAVVWVGGMLFLALVLVPVTRPLAARERGVLFAAIGQRFRVIGWSAMGVLVVTGVVNSAYRGITWESLGSGQLTSGTFGWLLAVKLGLVALMLVLGALHDVVLGPASIRMLEQDGPNAAKRGAALRAQASWLARLQTLLALMVVALAVALVRGLPG